MQVVIGLLVTPVNVLLDIFDASQFIPPTGLMLKKIQLLEKTGKLAAYIVAIVSVSHCPSLSPHAIDHHLIRREYLCTRSFATSFSTYFSRFPRQYWSIPCIFKVRGLYAQR
jgi:hypothetical protein